jgi:hypothetical protein
MHHILLFAAVFGALQFTANLTFLKKIGIPFAHNKRFTTQYDTYVKKDSLINTLFMGTSRTYRQIDPAIIDSVLATEKIKSYNLGATGTFHPENMYLFEEVVQHTSGTAPVKYLFMELTDLVPIEFVNWFAPQSYYYIDAGYLRFVLSSYFEREDFSFFQKIKYAYPFVQGYLLNHLFLVNPLHASPELAIYTGEHQNGFYPLDLDVQQNQKVQLKERYTAFKKDTSALTARLQIQYEQRKPHVNTTLLKRLNQMMARAEQHHIRMYYIIPPRLKEYRDMAALSEHLPENRVIDMGSHADYPDLYLAKYSFDVAHLNSQGAALYSRYLAQAIREKVFRTTDTGPTLIRH